MVENDVSGSEREEMVHEGQALVALGDAVPTQIDPRTGQGPAETLQAQGLGVCFRGRLWQYQLLSIWRISTCFLSVRQSVGVDDDSEIDLPIPRRRSLGKFEALRRSWQLPGTSSQ